MSFLHRVRYTVVKDQAGTVLQEEPLKDGRSSGDDGLARNETREKEPRRKTAATSAEGGDIRQDLQEDRRVGDQKENSRVFDWVTGNELLDIVEG
jgi:hypothetical protein